MEEILALQQQLAAVQKQDTKQRLGDRNIVELVLKLKQLGRLELIYTTDGKEFLTPEQLVREVADELEVSNGRIALGAIQPILNVDSHYIEIAAATLVEREADVELVGGTELVGATYLTALAEELNEELQQQGQTTIGDVAGRVSLPVDLVKRLLRQGLDRGSIQGQLSGSALYTDDFVARQRARMRGAFSALTMPTSISTVSKLHGFEEAMLKDQLAKLIAGGELAGTLKGGREYVPSAFVAMKSGELESFFADNGYISFDRARQLDVLDPVAALQAGAYQDCIGLDSCVVAASALAQLEAALDEVLQVAQEGSSTEVDIDADSAEMYWMHASPLLPTVLTEADVTSLLKKCDAVMQSPQWRPLSASLNKVELTAAAGSEANYVALLGHEYCVSHSFLSHCHARFLSGAKAFAEKVVQAAKTTRQATEDNGTGGQAEEENLAGGKGKRNKKGKKAAVMDDEEDDDGGSGKKGKKGKGRKGKRRGDDSSGDDEPAAAPEPKSSAKAKRAARKAKRGGGGGSDESNSTSTRTDLSAAEVRQSLEGWFPALSDHDLLADALVKILVESVGPVYSAAVAEALSSIHRGDARKNRDAEKQFDSQYTEVAHEVLMLQKGVAAWSSPTPGVPERCVLRMKCARIAALVTSFQCSKHGIEYETVLERDDELGGELPILQAEQAEEMRKKMDARTAACIVRLWTLSTAGRQSLDDFLQHLETAVLECNLPNITKIDKKLERQMVFAYRQDLSARLAAETNTAQALQLALALVFQQVRKAPVLLPANACAAQGLLDEVKEYLSETVLERLQDYVRNAPTADDLDDIRAVGASRDISAME
eukprot:g48.t1